MASYFTIDVYGIPANARGLIVMIAALAGGPVVGIPVGIIAGLWRFSLGGPTALACTVVTIIAGFIGSLINKWMGGKFLSPFKAALLMFLFSGFDMFMITILTPNQGVMIANALYAPMTFASVLGILLFTIFLDEKKEEFKIRENIEQINQNKEDIAINREDISINRENVSVNNENIFSNAEKISELSKKLNELQDELDELKKSSEGK